MWRVSPGGCLEYFQTNQSFLFSQDNQNINTQRSLLRIGPKALKETPERIIVWGVHGTDSGLGRREGWQRGPGGTGLDWLPFQLIESRAQDENPRQGEERGHQSLGYKNL